jgi:phospholipid/cholesterol/gamma-HCH transport system substrate-binding protein
MNKKYVSLGLFLVITLGLLFWLAQNVGALGSASGNAYTVRLDHAAGIVKDNAVKVAGVKVGIIEDVKVEHKTAVLHLRVDDEVALHDDTIAIVRAKSLLGEKYLQLDPGTLEAPLLKDGDQIAKVREVFEIDQMLNALEPILGGDESIGAMVQPLVAKLDNALGSAMGSDGSEPLMTKEELQASIDDVQASITAARRTIENLEPKIDGTLTDTNTLIADADRVINNPRIPRILADVEKISSTTAEHLPGLLAKTERALDAIDRVSNELTPERMERVGEILDDVSVTTANLRKMSEDIKDIGGDLGSVMANLRLLLKRAASIDELTIRQFIQKEGMRVNLNVPKNAKGRIEELESAAGQ